MQKLKRNETIEKGIILTSILSKVDEKTTYEVMDATVKAYKGRENKKLFTDEETDTIMQALQSMPGYAPEKLLAAGAPMKRSENSSYGSFGWVLYVAYIMLSITNPELFDDYKEKPFFNPDGNYASEFIKRKLKEEMNGKNI